MFLFLIIQMFQNIINNSVKAKHKNSFKKQRMSMLPAVVKPAVSAGGGCNNQTANSNVSDRHSMVSGTAPFHVEPSDMEVLSLGAAGGAQSEAGSLFEPAPNDAAAEDDYRRLKIAYDELNM